MQTSEDVLIKPNEIVNDVPYNKNAPEQTQDTYSNHPAIEDMLNDLRNNSKQDYVTQLHSSRKLIGRIIVLFKRLVRKSTRFLLLPIVNKQSEFNAKSISLSATLFEVNEKTNEHLYSCISELQSYMDRMINEQLKSQKAAFINTLEAFVKNQQNQHEKLELSVFRAINHFAYDTRKAPQKSISDEQIQFDYFDFENQFRGTREEIKKRLEVYIKYLKERKHIVDIGCGRGDFLELLQENDISAIGVDISKEFVDFCSFNGFEALHGDAIEYLATLEENSIDAITGFHIVEHLSLEQMMQLCSLAFKKLKMDGILILETPNPASLSIYSNAFYLDPSHNKPVHPLLLKYIAEKSGFSKVELQFTDSSKPCAELPWLEIPGGCTVGFNEGIKNITDVLFGSQDYAMIAEKQ